MGYYLRGEIHAHSIFYSTRLVSLEIEVLFSPFLFFLWRIRDRKQALLLALNPLFSLCSLFSLSLPPCVSRGRAETRLTEEEEDREEEEEVEVRDREEGMPDCIKTSLLSILRVLH